MGKSATLNLRVNPELKHDAEQVLSRLGLPMSVAVDLFLNQIVLNNGLPFTVAVPESIDATKMNPNVLYNYAA